MKVLYTKSTRERLPQFQIETIIFEENNIRKVRKRPLTFEAKKHIQSVYENSVNLSKVYNNVEVLVPILSDDSLYFPYIPGITWDDLLLDRLLSHDKEGFLKLLQDFYNLLLHLQNNEPKHYKSTIKFNRIFGIELDIENCIYLDPANIDIIFENVFVNDQGKTIMFDCEWVFPFEIPVIFVMWRSLYALWVKHQYHIRNFFEFDEICMLFGIHNDLQKKFEIMEENYFQAYVHGEGNQYLNNYLKPTYNFEFINKLIEKEKFEIKVFLPVNNVYTYVQAIESIFDDEHRVHEFYFAESFQDHIRIDPIDNEALIEIKEIEVYAVENGAPTELITQSNFFNQFENLTFSEDVIVFDKKNNFTFFASSKQTHLFLKILNPIDGNFMVRLVMKVHHRISNILAQKIKTLFLENVHQKKVISEELITLNELLAEKDNMLNESSIKLEILQRNYEHLNSINHEIQLRIENQITEKDILEKQMQEQVSKINGLQLYLDEQINRNNKLQMELEEKSRELSEFKVLINNIYNSKTWKLTAPIRFLKKISKRE